MSLQIVSGKPGSGKSYHTVTMLLKELSDWAIFERKEKKKFDSSLWTNLPLNIEVINEYLTKELGSEVDISDYIHPIDEDVRRQFWTNGKFPLCNFPQNSLIVIDEVQRMFDAEIDTGTKGKDFVVQFRNYISEHRHYGHNLIFITQHTDNVSTSILAMAEKLYQVTNAKSLSLPFPLNIPFSDIDVIKEAWGLKTQCYRVNVGKYFGRRVRFDNEVTTHLMTDAVFRCYTSHTLKDISSDKPSLNLTRLGSIIWFCKRHFFHLFLKSVVVFFVVWIGSRLLFELPQKLLASINLGGSIIPSENAKLPKVLPVKNDHAPDPSKVSTPDPLIEDILSPSPAPVLSLPSPVKLLDDKVLMIIGGELYTNKGRLSVGSDFIFEGATETIKKIDVRLGMIFFESEKYLRVPK